MKDKITEIENQETIKYLEEILSRIALISNPMKLSVPEFGEVTATSMVQFHYPYGKRPFPYFSFKKDKNEEEYEYGEFYRKDGKYFLEIKESGEQK